MIRRILALSCFGVATATAGGSAPYQSSIRPEHFLAGDAYRCKGPTLLLRRSVEQKYQLGADWFGLDELIAKLTSDGAPKALGCVEIWVTCTSEDADVAFMSAVVKAGASFRTIETTQDRDLLKYPRETKLMQCSHAH